MGKFEIEEVLNKNCNKLIITDKRATAEILDAELDTIKCNFNNDDCVNIDTENLTYIVLTIDNLRKLERLIIEAKKYYKLNK